MSTPHPRPQSFANHRAVPPVHYLLAGVMLLVAAGRVGWLAFRAPGFWSVWGFLAAVALVIVWYESRRRAQVVQDRVIRLELRLRLERLLGPERRADVERLTLPQLIGLRFASDAEMPALLDDTLARPESTPDEIKRRVRDWQADWLRV